MCVISKDQTGKCSFCRKYSTTRKSYIGFGVVVKSGDKGECCAVHWNNVLTLIESARAAFLHMRSQSTRLIINSVMSVVASNAVESLQRAAGDVGGRHRHPRDRRHRSGCRLTRPWTRLLIQRRQRLVVNGRCDHTHTTSWWRRPPYYWHNQYSSPWQGHASVIFWIMKIFIHHNNGSIAQ